MLSYNALDLCNKTNLIAIQRKDVSVTQFIIIVIRYDGFGPAYLQAFQKNIEATLADNWHYFTSFIRDIAKITALQPLGM